MNMNLKLEIDPKKLLPALMKAEPYLFGLAMIAVFGYTAWVVNGLLNVQPAPSTSTTTSTKPVPKITFDKGAIESVKKLDAVQASVPKGDLGKDDPFK